MLSTHSGDSLSAVSANECLNYWIGLTQIDPRAQALNGPNDPAGRAQHHGYSLAESSD